MSACPVLSQKAQVRLRHVQLVVWRRRGATA